MQTLDDDTVTIPNHLFLSETVASANAGSLHMMVTTEFFLDPQEDHLRAAELLREVTVTCRFVYLKNPVEVTATEVTAANRFATKLTVKCCVLDARFQEALQTDLTMRGRKVLTEAQIGRPAGEVILT
jgi:small-conductance mechanosensitive channel